MKCSGRVICTLLVLLTLASCSSIIKGKSQLVSIDSNVKGADVIINGKTIGQTPFTGPIERDSSSTITVKKEGYTSKTITPTTEVEPVFWGNILCGGGVGSSTDLSTGAMYKYAPSTFQIDLAKAEGN
ncbi:MAG: PEGA domain-containing protein [Bacteriovorax sp.]